MNWRQTSQKGSLGTGTVKHEIDVIYVPNGATRLTEIECCAIAWEYTIPFSIYPVEFFFESGSLPFDFPFSCMAMRTGAKKVSYNIKLNISVYNGARILIRAQSTKPNVIAPVAFCVLRGD